MIFKVRQNVISKASFHNKICESNFCVLLQNCMTKCHGEWFTGKFLVFFCSHNKLRNWPYKLTKFHTIFKLFLVNKFNKIKGSDWDILLIWIINIFILLYCVDVKNVVISCSSSNYLFYFTPFADENGYHYFWCKIMLIFIIIKIIMMINVSLIPRSKSSFQLSYRIVIKGKVSSRES